MYFIIGKLYQLSSFYHTHTQCIIIKIDLHIAYSTLNRVFNSNWCKVSKIVVNYLVVSRI